MEDHDKDDDRLHRIRHSLAHVLAQAVLELRPGSTLGFGPPIEPGANYGETLLEIARFMRASLPDYERYKVLEQQALRLVAENAE